jgi:Protein of unknown function (DUF2442)
MSIFPTNLTGVVQATGVQFDGDRLTVRLSDGREVSVPWSKLEWLQWLAKATPEQRAHWSIEPGGFAVYWEDLDDGFEITHWLAMQPLG